MPQDACDRVLALLPCKDWRTSRASSPAAAALQLWENGRGSWPLLQEYATCQKLVALTRSGKASST